MSSRTLLPSFVCVLVFTPQGNPVSAHEHTLPAHAASLRADAAAEEGHHKPATGAVCRLTLELVDADTGDPLPGLARVKTADGQVAPLAGLFNRGTGLRQDHAARDWHVVLEPVTVSVPQARLTVEAVCGLETELARQTVDLAGKATARLTLRPKRFSSVGSRGWRGGNTHLHLMSLSREEADQYLRSIALADELELAFVSYLRRVKAEKNYISNTYTKEDLERLSGGGVFFGYGEEHRHNIGPGGEGYGHVMFLDVEELIRPVSIGPGIMGEGTDWPTIRRGIEAARRQGATTVWCHNAFGMEDVPNWLAGTLDAHNIFDGGSRGGYDDTFYRFMNVGLRVPFSAGTDWFMYDFSRVYVELEGPLTVERWLDALEQGKSFITNGPLLELEVEGRRPGDVIRLAEPGELTVRGTAVGRCDFQRLEVVSGGSVVAAEPSRPVGGHFEATLAASLTVNRPGWIVLRVDSDHKNELGGSLFGHTSAVYVELAGKSVFLPQAAEELIADMQQAIGTIRQKATFADDEQREQVLKVYREGIATLRKRMEQHARRTPESTAR
ncbi:MAG: CehA/McbA family metallohydrolase [Planctomycetota bacterium]|jgi:hypothetical protein